MKKIVFFLAKYSSFLDNYVNRWMLVGRVPIGLLVVNFFYQKILKINNGTKIPVNFTSVVTNFEKIEMVFDPISVGSFSISGNCYIQAKNGLKLGSNFLFAPGVKLISSNHDMSNRKENVSGNPIILGDNIWLGANVIVLPGVELGDNCVVGAGSVVTKSFSEKNLILAGNPAKIIKRII